MESKGVKVVTDGKYTRQFDRPEKTLDDFHKDILTNVAEMIDEYHSSSHRPNTRNDIKFRDEDGKQYNAGINVIDYSKNKYATTSVKGGRADVMHISVTITEQPAATQSTQNPLQPLVKKIASLRKEKDVQFPQIITPLADNNYMMNVSREKFKNKEGVESSTTQFDLAIPKSKLIQLESELTKASSGLRTRGEGWNLY